MSEIELTIKAIETLLKTTEINNNIIATTLISGVLTIFIGFFLYIDDYSKKKYVPILCTGSFVIMISIFIIIDQLGNYDELVELTKKRNNLITNEINSMSCHELRINILNILEGKEFKPEWLGSRLDEKKDVYFYKCETPLREEVIKLQ